MSLPVPPRPTGTVTIDGQDVEVRGLSRAEALRFGTAFSEEAMPDAPIADRVDAAEIYAIATGAGVSDDEARAWRQQVGSDVVEALLQKILQLSGLAEPDPKTRFERDFVEGRLDPFDFILAEALGMTVAALRADMPNLEYQQWRAFYSVRHEMRELAARKAAKKQEVRRRGRR